MSASGGAGVQEGDGGGVSFSIPRSGGEAQETRERRRKKALWG
jgi:hypothetical protein